MLVGFEEPPDAGNESPVDERSRRPVVAALVAVPLVPAIRRRSGRRRERRGEGGHGAQAGGASGISRSLLEAFLREMPKGGDLHNHLSGSIYAESYHPLGGRGQPVRRRRRRSRSRRRRATRPPGGRPRAAVLQDSGALQRDRSTPGRCATGRRTSTATIISSRRSRSSAAVTSVACGDMLAEVTSRAAAEHVSYLELMLTPDGGVATRLGREAGWTAGTSPQMRTRAARARAGATCSTQTKQRLDAAEARRNELLQVRDARGRPGLPRHRPLHLAGPARRPARSRCSRRFWRASSWPTARTARRRHQSRAAGRRPGGGPRFLAALSMIDFLHGALSQAVTITLHAGRARRRPGAARGAALPHPRLDPQGHAQRIGHGMDVHAGGRPDRPAARDGGEEDPRRDRAHQQRPDPRREGSAHPLRTYLQYGVPVALATDDSASRDRATRSSG